MFAICRNKGFHITFENGYTVSVQWGVGNYGDNYDLEPSELGPTREVPPSTQAEVGVWDTYGWHGNPEGDVAGYQSPAQVLAILNTVAALPRRHGPST